MTLFCLLLRTEHQLEELRGGQEGLIKARRGFEAEQTAFGDALAAFAPGLGAGKFLNAAFARHWKAQAAAQAV